MPCWYVYTAVYKLAADGAVFDAHEKKSMVRGAPKRKPRYLISRFMLSFLLCDTYQVRTYNKGQHPNHKKKLATHVYSSLQACF